MEGPLERTPGALLKEIGRVKIELNSCEGASKEELQAKLEGLLAEHAGASQAVSKAICPMGPSGEMPKAAPKAAAKVPAEPPKPKKPAAQGEPPVPKVAKKPAAERRPKAAGPKASGQSELDRWLQKQRRKASEDGLNFSGGGAASTADVVTPEAAPAAKSSSSSFASGRPGDVEAFRGLVVSSENDWSLDDRCGRYVFDAGSGWLHEADSKEKLGRLSLAKIQESELQLAEEFSKLTSQNLRIVSSEIMAEMQNPENEGALFVLPSQLNGAEYPSESSIKSKVVDYKYDNTGGPRGQLAAHPAVAQFILDNAANAEREGGINAVDEVLSKVSGLELVNGYLKIQAGDAAANARCVEELRQHLHLLRCLVMDEVPAAGLAANKREWSSRSHKVGLVYASAVPVDSYLNRGSVPLEHQKAVAEWILVAQYLAALRYAASAEKRKVFLMPLGGGVFNNPWDIIAKSMARALQTLDDESLARLEISALAWQGNPEEERQLQEMFMALNPAYQAASQEESSGVAVEATEEVSMSHVPSGRVSFSHPDDVRHFHAEDSPKDAPLALHGLNPPSEAESTTKVAEDLSPAEAASPEAAVAAVVEDIPPAEPASASDAAATVVEDPAPEPASTADAAVVEAPEDVPTAEPAEAAAVEELPAPEPASASQAGAEKDSKPTSLASLAACAAAAASEASIPVPEAKSKSKDAKAKATPKAVNREARITKTVAAATTVPKASKDVKAAKVAATDVPKPKATPKAGPSESKVAGGAGAAKSVKAKAAAAPAKSPASPASPPPVRPLGGPRGPGSPASPPKAGTKTPEVKPAKTAKPATTSSSPGETAPKAKAAPRSPASGSATKSLQQAAKAVPKQPLRIASQKALERKAKEMEQNVKAAQAACLRDSRQSSGRLKCLEVEAAKLRRALEAPPKGPKAAAAPAAPRDEAVLATAALEPEEAAEAFPEAPEAEDADTRKSPRSTSSSLRLKLESLVQEEEDDAQLALQLQQVLDSEGLGSGSASGTSKSPPRSPEQSVQSRSPVQSPAKGRGRGKGRPAAEAPEGKVPARSPQKPSPRPSEDPGDRPAWDDRWYVVEVPKPRRRSGLEDEVLAKDEVPKPKTSPRPKASPRPAEPVPSPEAKRSPKAKAKAQEKAKPKEAAKPAQAALSAAERFAADRAERHKVRQASR